MRNFVLDIIVIDLYSVGGFPLEEASELMGVLYALQTH
jgi:hypothetical protein